MNGAWMKMILRAHQSPVTANARWRLSGWAAVLQSQHHKCRPQARFSPS
jgi:hypothetical protein